jgi:hypothetical protein
MGKKKECFGDETFVCMTPNCPYARECIQVVWEKRLERIVTKRNLPPKKRSRSRLTVEG